MDDDLFRAKLLRRLDTLIAVMLDASPSESAPVAAKIKRLASAGLTPTEIGSILGKPANYVTASLSDQKKSAARRSRR
jgi:hypothetical protein